MIAVLKYNLSNPEDKRLFEIANKAESMLFALSDITNLYSYFKHNEEINWDTFDLITGRIKEILDEKQITTDFIDENA